MKKGDYLFVYGTLRLGEAMDLSEKKNFSGVSHVGSDRVNGNIYDLGSYPGAETFKVHAFNPKYSTIVGDVFVIDNDASVLGLDNYEGYPYLYGRVEVPTETGLTAWIYTYNGRMPESRMIDGGDWKYRRGEANMRFQRRASI